MAITPAGDRIAIVDLPAEDTSKLIMPMGVAGRPDVGLVVDVGEDCRLGISKGDKVFYRCKAVEIEGLKIIDGGCVIAFEGDG